MKTVSRFQVIEYKNDSGTISYRVTGSLPDGRRIRENFKEKPLAFARRNELDIEAINAQAEMFTLRPTRLSVTQEDDAVAALRRLDGHGSMFDAADFYRRNWRPMESITVADAVQQFVKDKTAKGLRPRSLESLRGRLARLESTHGARSVGDVKADELRVLLQRGQSAQTFNGEKAAIHNFFAWAMRRDYCPNNPCTRIDCARVEHSEPVILSLDEVKSLLAATLAYKQGVLVPFMSLSLFGGIRPKELERIGWSDIDLDGRTVVIRGAAAKTRGRRVVELDENTVQWLQPHAKRQTPIVGKNWRRDWDAVRRASGFVGSVNRTRKDEGLKPWPSDVLRHSAVSYWQAFHKDEGAAADRHGNSVDVIHRHYRGVVKSPDAQAFWKLTPETVLADVDAAGVPAEACAA